MKLDIFDYLNLKDLIEEKIEELKKEARNSANWDFYADEIAKYRSLEYVLERMME